MEFGQAVNRPSPIPAHVTFCVQTVYTPVTMSPNSHAVSFNFLKADFGTTRGQLSFWVNCSKADGIYSPTQNRMRRQLRGLLLIYEYRLE